MNNMDNKLTQNQVIEICGMINQRLAYIAGPNLSSDLSSDFVIIVTDKDSYGLQGDVHQDFLEGFSELYSSIETCEVDKDELEEARTRGNQYFFNKGEVISEIFLVRDSIEGFNEAKETWQYNSDIGIVLRLESGYVSITRLGYHDEMLQVSYYGELTVANIPRTHGRFESDLHSNFTVKRSFIKV